MGSYLHHGPWDAHSRQSRALNFVEKYFTAVGFLNLTSTPPSEFYFPLAILHDSKGDAHLGGAAIWQWMQRILSPFCKVAHEVVEVRVVSNAEGMDVVYAEFLTHFTLKGDKEVVMAPQFFIMTIGDAVDGAGTDGLQFVEVRLFWDTSILGRYVTEKNKREMERANALL